MKRMKNLIEKVFQSVRKWLVGAGDNNKMEHLVTASGKQVEKTSTGKVTEALIAMEDFLQNLYDFRFNKLTEETEYRMRDIPGGYFQPIGQRELNSFCLAARKDGVDCWDRDISRYINSNSIEEYHPFRLFMDELPAWDGTDRVDDLARNAVMGREFPSLVAGYGCTMVGDGLVTW